MNNIETNNLKRTVKTTVFPNPMIDLKLQQLYHKLAALEEELMKLQHMALYGGHWLQERIAQLKAEINAVVTEITALEQAQFPDVPVRPGRRFYPDPEYPWTTPEPKYPWKTTEPEYPGLKPKPEPEYPPRRYNPKPEIVLYQNTAVSESKLKKYQEDYLSGKINLDNAKKYQDFLKNKQENGLEPEL